MRIAAESLDHVLLGAPTLEKGIAWLEERTGVRAAPGGSHPGLGTWNALASLGPAKYIEIIAPDPGQPGVVTFYVPGLRDLAAPRFVTWAAKGGDLASGFQATLPRDMACESARPGSRILLDGTPLSWTLAFPTHRSHGAFAGLLPFLIEWGSEEQHPGKSTPRGLTLRALHLRHPESGALNHALAALGVTGGATHAAEASIGIELETTRGAVLL
ncbi:MAG: VOC family protein [Vicinamibacteria bacterium]